MGNRVNYIHAINFTHRKTKETKKIRQNPEKWSCDFSNEFSWLHFISVEPTCVPRPYFRSFCKSLIYK